MILRLVLAAMLLSIVPNPAVAAQRGDVFRHAKAATALVVAINDPTRSVSLGSGFFVDADGLLVTNAHVIEDSTRLYLYVRDQAVYTAPEVVAVDPDLDLAALRISPADVDTLALALETPAEGTEVIAVGYPRITDILQMGFALHATIVPGTVSGHAQGQSRTQGRHASFIQTTGILNFGNSGGPLVDSTSGEALGMVVTTVPYLERAKDRTGATVGSVMMKAGISYSIPAPVIRQWLASNHLVPRPSPASTERPARPRADQVAQRSFVTGHLLQTMAVVLQKDADLLNLAVRHYEAATLLEPDAPWINGHLGLAYATLERWDQALEAYQKALAQSPDDAELLANAGHAWLRTGHRERAAEAFRAAIQVNPRFSRAHNDLGSLLWQMGKVDDAIVEFRRALDSEPASPLAAYNLGLALEAKGLRAEAGATWRTFLDNNQGRSDPDGWHSKIREKVRAPGIAHDAPPAEAPPARTVSGMTRSK